MKKHFLLLTIFMINVVSFSIAQSTRVTSAGISIQGIARDANNSAIALANNVGVSIRIYKITNEQNNTQANVLTRNATVRTDDFGVFSYVLEIPESIFESIGSFDTYMELSSNGVIFLNEKLQSVPYAIHAVRANNGVPTGSIMPFVGDSTQVPEGWLLCDGSTIPDDDYHADLRGLLGANTPNLKGVYLRGAGSQTIPTLGSNGNSNFGANGKEYNAGNINTFHIDRYQSHRHVINSLTGSPEDDQDTSNWTGARSISPGGRSFTDFLWRVNEGVITGSDGGYATSADKVADGKHKHVAYLYSNTGDTRFVNDDTAWGYHDELVEGVVDENGAPEASSVHQHRVYGKTWFEPHGTPDDTSWAKPPPPSQTETAPVWYSIHYIVKI